MSEKPQSLVPSFAGHHASEGEALRLLSRSPHPYHRPGVQLSPTSGANGISSPSPLQSSQNTDDESHAAYTDKPGSPRSLDSDSGTEADDEHFLKGLPAPRLRPHKGLRGREGFVSGTSTPLLSPALLSDESRKQIGKSRRSPGTISSVTEDEQKNAAERFTRRRRIEIKRRATEILLLVLVGIFVLSGKEIRAVIRIWKHGKKLYVATANIADEVEISCQILMIATLLVLYPLRLLYYLSSQKAFESRPFVSVPSVFDPARLLYPPVLTILVSALLSVNNPEVVLFNIVLSLASLPPELIPIAGGGESLSVVHWFISCIPIFSSQAVLSSLHLLTSGNWSPLDPEVLVLLYPLHQALCTTLYYLTTTSLLTAELQLLSIALINLLLLSSSPQAIILKSLLWGGGLCTLALCGRVLTWGVALARVPRWRFRRPKHHEKSDPIETEDRARRSLLSKLISAFSSRSSESNDDSDEDDTLQSIIKRRSSDLMSNLLDKNDPLIMRAAIRSRAAESLKLVDFSSTGARLSQGRDTSFKHQRRNTLSNLDEKRMKNLKMTSSGRRKRSASTLQGFFSLTERQATVRKWLYASYVYFCVLMIILFGIREYVGRYSLGEKEPIGWALGYLFGNVSWFRMQVVTENLEYWICLPPHLTSNLESCHSGWVEHLRQSTFGPANTRLILCLYWIAIITVGLAVVFRLSAIYEVDTRRKVFHFMMVAMLLPTIFIDPTFAALALSLVLAIFLLLDLFRASQLPPLSKPLAYFLTPYVDGRDLRGPVVISHIFLLIGCAIPLWLSLGALPRTGTGYLAGWEVPTRDISMVSGVICVGLGDAAASLIGRRYGRHKWIWTGGKSIEGSLAFATVVCMALLAAKLWLVIGGWQSDIQDAWVSTVWKAGLAAGVASLTEAVLTGGNDNVVVPVVLWLCVKGLKI